METVTTTKQYVTVTNRNNGTTGYTLTNGFRRQFAIGQSKDIDIAELKELIGIPGGEYILQNYLVIEDQAALSYLNLHTEPEYFYTEKEIKELLLQGSLEQLEDCLNFAPEGVLDLIQSIAIDIKLPDVRKRDLIFKKTGFNISNALMVNQVLEGDNAQVVEEKKTRKAAPIKTAPERKTTPKYVRMEKEKKE